MGHKDEERSNGLRVPIADLLYSAAESAPADARERIRARVVAAGVASVASGARRRRVLVWAALSVAVCVVATAGIGFAAQDSLPGDLLYPVKRVSERAHVIVVPAGERANIYLGQADERIREVERLLNAGASTRALNQAVQGFSNAAQRAVDDEPDAAAALRRVEEIRRHVEEAPPAVRQVIESALQDLERAPGIQPPVLPLAPPVQPQPEDPPNGGTAPPDDLGQPPAAPPARPGDEGSEDAGLEPSGELPVSRLPESAEYVELDLMAIPRILVDELHYPEPRP